MTNFLLSGEISGNIDIRDIKTVKKRRLDELLVARGLAENRSKAQAIIMAGEVTVNGQPASKPGMMVRLGILGKEARLTG